MVRESSFSIERRQPAFLLLGVVLAVLAASGLPARAGKGKAPEPQVEAEAEAPEVEAPEVEASEAEASDEAYLGVELEEETELPEGGARITQVVEDSPAAAAGLEEGDVIVEFDEQVVRGPVSLSKKIEARAPGERVRITAVRDGRKVKLEAELGRREYPRVYTFDGNHLQEVEGEIADRLKKAKGRAKAYNFALPEVRTAPYASLLLDWTRPKLGVQLVDTTPELRRHLGGSEERGVLVSKVLSGTPAQRAGIKVGDLIVSVDGKPVGTVEELRAALEGHEGKTFRVAVVRDGRALDLEGAFPSPEDEVPTGPRA